MGQWNEEFNTYSLNGITQTTVPATISIYGGYDAVEAQAYGIAEDSGYYITEGGLKCKNAGIPFSLWCKWSNKIRTRHRCIFNYSR